MKQIFCTLFNQKFFSRGLALYNSLIRLEVDFQLYIFAFDQETEKYLSELNLKNVVVIGLKEFEDEELLKVKSTRTMQEYCWTCASSTIYYCLNNFQIDHCTYLDADIYFFSDPIILFNEFGNNSVMITEHKYAEEYDQTETSGKYCVQYISFKNDEIGREIIKYWRNACIEWCYARFEDGKFGDQKYLDDWTTRFKGVKVVENIGAGLAPWNVSKYDISSKNNQIKLKEINSEKIYDLVFYHFHDLKFKDDGEWYFVSGILGYKIWKDTLQSIYSRYLKELFHISNLHSKKIFSDYPSLPEKIQNDILFGEILPSFDDFNTKQTFRNSYSKFKNGYCFLNEIDEKQKINLFNLLVEIDFGLDRYKNAFFYLSNHINIYSTGDIDSLIMLKDIFLKKKAYTLLMVNKKNYQEAISMEQEEFHINFKFHKSIKTNSFQWKPLESFVSNVILNSIKITTETNSEFLIPKDSISNNGKLIENEWIEFEKYNQFYEIKLNEEISINSIQFICKLKKVEYEHQLDKYENQINQLIHETQLEITNLKNEIDIFKSSIFFKIRKVIITPILFIIKLFEKK